MTGAVSQVSVGALAGSVFLVAGLVVAAFVAAAVSGTLYRWYARERIPEGLAVLAGLGVVAIYLNTDAALSQVIGGGGGFLDPDLAVRNTVTFLVAAAAALVGGRAGDRLAGQLGVVTGARELDVELSRLVRTVGRMTPVTLPETPEGIDDIEGYDPVPAETKEALAGKTLVFPRGLTVAELQERLAERLVADYGVGHVDADVAPDGTVDFLALGRGAAGIGPTLVPGTAAIAVLADPPFSATSGDSVQLWSTTEPEPERVASGELRSAAGDVVTLSLDEVDAASIDPVPRYRLVTLPSETRPDREFASILRRADETMGVVRIPEGSPLVGSTIGEVDVAVVAVQPSGGAVEAIPPRGRSIAAGDRLYAIARPEGLRRLERAAAEAEVDRQPEPS